VAITIFLQVYLYSKGFSLVEVGLIGGLNGATLALTQVLIGKPLDRMRGKRNYAVMASAILRGVFVLAMVLAVSFPLECAWAILYGASTAPFMPATMAMVSDEGTRSDMGKRMGNYRMAGSLGWTIGNLAFGAIGLVSIMAAFIMAALLNFAASVPMILHQDKSFPQPEGVAEQTGAGGQAPPDPRGTKKPGNDAAASDASAGARRGRLADRRVMAYFLGSVLLISLTTGAGNQFLPVYLSTLKASSFLIGAVIATGSAAEIPFMHAGGRLSDKLGDEFSMMIGSLSFSAVYVAYSVISIPTVFIAVQAARGMSYAFYHSSSMAFTQRDNPGTRGSSAALYNAFLNAGSTLGSFTGGAIATIAGFDGLFLSLSGLAVFSLALVWLLTRH